jgi:SAM-dependent methyltransferase
MIRSPEDIREAYRDAAVAETYIDQRFGQPLGALLHSRQVRFLKRLLAKQRPGRVLEIAPGPARLTTAVASWLPRGTTILDASAPMLAQARRRLTGSTGWEGRFIQGDAFHLPFRSEFDVVYTFRFIRHFEAESRLSLYGQIVKVLRPRGLLVFDVVNETVSGPLRERAKPGEYRHYDALLRPAGLTAELAQAGLQLVSLDGVQRRYSLLSRMQSLVAPRSRLLARGAMEVVARLGGEPLEWIATCRRA